ncbi:soluble inorganic pyrophosphatase, putative [Perkinsus marinus ATCC 50983]|uniref:inorganic diphosphatase n=1 Tax=Perkinsus marinus (strain ATCC 50983 / TXsc) TaxID=423536 RepID=C5LHB2_PERM5|nr:soluble inorganic pyrophosphatase, putative [Perkinsus marinus ATCC 50983]EER03921.1 soluble inorganic pyrophosphatase, putative [Perkinsus marinus ATCC 50983]|eukprot:XP_002772105.1 soluble inorganic pyrophosphatase, putative [Perkinsus marinus ATCC 50983]
MARLRQGTRFLGLIIGVALCVLNSSLFVQPSTQASTAANAALVGSVRAAVGLGLIMFTRAVGRKALPERYQLMDAGTGEHRSFWHDIPLRGSEGKFMFVTEIPRGMLARYELEPDTSDIANDPRGTTALKKLGEGPCFNYGFLPQTWSDPIDWHDKITGLKGDGDPLDLIEISGKHFSPGEVAQVQVLGAVCLIDEGAADWKLIGTACCKALTDEEVAREMEKVKAWMDGYKALFAKEPTQWYLNGMIFDRTIALDLIDQQNKVWLKKKGLKASKATSKNYKVVTK